MSETEGQSPCNLETATNTSPAPASTSRPDTARLANLREGAEAERQALRYLERQGLQLIVRNHRCKCGELDLLMAHGDTVVVVEVRMRSSNRHGSALESVSRLKQQRISRCAGLWWVQRGQREFKHLRFDVVALENGSEPLWVQNAWQISN